MILLLVVSFLLQIPLPEGAEEIPARLPLEEILSEKDWQKYIQKTQYHDKVKILRTTLEQKQKGLHGFVDARNLADIFRELAEIRGLTHHAFELSKSESDRKELQHREVKRLEIRLRKLAEVLDDLRLAVPLENRSQFDDTKLLVEELRDKLLKQLFGQVLGQNTPSNPFPAAFSLTAPSVPAASRTSLQGLWDLDKFTELEFSSLQDAQKLDKRMKVLFEICEARFAEIDRRRQEIEWDREEPNPLEFFTYEDMLFGYTRAVNAMMANIDSQYESGAASERDIKKALRRLKEKLEEFQPLLDALMELVKEQRDEGFYNQYQEALRASEVAYKGAKNGLEQLSKE